MLLVRLIYASSISDQFTAADIGKILESARKHNQSNDITGVLYFNNKFFLQCLEGSRSNVNHTYHRILGDPRHANVIQLDFREVSARSFSGWKMGFIENTDATKSIHLKYSASTQFSPYDMTAESAFKMLLELKSAIPSI